MSILNNVRKLFGIKEEAKEVPTDHWMGPGYDFRQWQHDDLETDKNQVLSTNEEIFGVVTRLSNTMASLPLHKYHKYDEQDDSLASLIRVQPNPNMSGFELIRGTERARNVAGNGYIWIKRDLTGTPVELWPIDPGSVTIQRNIDDGSIWYRVDDAEGHHFLLPNIDMIHVRHISQISSTVGISPIDVLTGSLRFQKAIEDFSMREMSKKDMFVLKYDRSMKESARKAMIQDFTRMVREDGGAIVQEAGWDIDHFNSDFKPTDLSTSEGITRMRIANAFNVPLSFLNDGTAKSTVNVEHVMTQFVITTLVPIVREYESELNRKLLTSNQIARGNYFKFNVNGLMRGDTAARTEFYQMMIRNGLATQNELRKLEDLPPLKEKSANMTWISKDLFPAESQLEASLNPVSGQTDKAKGNINDDQQDDQNQPVKGGDASDRGKDKKDNESAKVSNN